MQYHLPKKYHRGGKKRKKGNRNKNKSFNFGLNFVNADLLGLPVKKIKK